VERETEYDLHDVARLRVEITVDDAPATPDEITVKVRKPDGTVAVATPAAGGGGVYVHEIPLDQAGRWFYRFEGTGAAAGAAERAFRVRPSRFP
jgi:hypothetical protein